MHVDTSLVFKGDLVLPNVVINASYSLSLLTLLIAIISIVIIATNNSKLIHVICIPTLPNHLFNI